ncbi:autotransporter outer membrane beta-barrel domain-containing protein [Sphingomonas koreensis]|uniref:autotransporter outer membrane beta-barrel domain-containing protein n=1 Tax=Sphingomonas koreensis TaxID=93064 RepID=UPI000F7ED663|nr:autotransporter outer membrane beta-barrel domain-containing protein [Sphingomonas koreensis]
MIQSASARTRLLTYGASAIALMAAMASPAFAQTAAQPGDAQCPIVDGVVTCTGNVAGGFLADRNATMQRLIFRDLTVPIAPPSERSAIDVRPIGDLTLELDSSVTINSVRPLSSFLYGGSTQRPDATVALIFDAALQTNATVNNAGTINVSEFYDSRDVNMGAFLIADADLVDFTNSGTITVTNSNGSTLPSSASRLSSGVRVVGADQIQFRNDGTIRNTGYLTSGVSLLGRSIQFLNNGLIEASAGTYSDDRGVSRPATGTAAATIDDPAVLEFRNTGTIRSTTAPYAAESQFTLLGRGTANIVNSGTLASSGLIFTGGAQNATDDLSVTVSNSGEVSNTELFIDAGNRFSDTNGTLRPLYRNVDLSFENTGRFTTAALTVAGKAENVRIDIVNRGRFAGPAASFFGLGRTRVNDPIEWIAVNGAAPIAGTASVRVANYADMSIANGDVNATGYNMISASSSHDLDLENYGKISFDFDIDSPRINGINVHQGERYNQETADYEYNFDRVARILNEGEISLNIETGFQSSVAISAEALSQLNITNTGQISLENNFVEMPYFTAGIKLSAFGDAVVNNDGAISVTNVSGLESNFGSIGIAFREVSLRQADAERLAASGDLGGYVRADDLASVVTINLNASDVTANGTGSYGMFGIIGTDVSASASGLLGIPVRTIGNDGAVARINIADGVSVFGGTGDGAGIVLQGAGRMTLNNAGSVVHRGDATGGAVVLGRLNTWNTILGSQPTPPQFALSLIDSVNSGTITGGSGRGIWVQAGSIENFVNSGVVRGGAGAISSSGRGQVTNLASGTIDGAVVLSGANSVLTNSGLVRLSGPGAVASTVNGDWMQSAGRLELGLDDTLSVMGNMTLAGELGVTLGAPTSTRIVDVGGDLSVDARLDVTGDAGFGQGVYRLFDYGGTLSGSGLTVTTMPTGTSGTIQTAIAGQINLVVGGGVTPTPDIQFWDGAQTEANGAVNGGAGIWGGTATNWTDMNGAANAAWGSKFAVFQGTPGTVTIAPEGVSASGLQFAVDGYRVEGGTLTLTAPATLRVGDASAAGAGYTATIASTIAGSGGIDKTDLGTLVLTGVNTYTGGTRISGGTLAVSSDGALGAASGGLTFGGGGLRADGAFSSTRAITVNAGGGTIDTQANAVTLSGSLTGSGALAKAGSGTLTFSGDGSAYTGTLTNRAGTLAISGNFGGSVVSQGSVLTVGGSVAGDVTVGAGAATIGTTGRIGGDLFATGSAAVRLDGAVTGNADIASGARLSGIGSIGGDLILAGTFAPGNSVGAISVGGNATFAAGSVFDLELDADGSGDTLSVMGTTTIAGGTVRITTLDPELDYANGSEYTFITSTGGLTGTFDSLSETSAFLDFVLGYDANRAFVTVDVVRTFPDVAQTFNQRQASIGLAALDRTEGSDSLAAYNAILFLDEAPARAAFDAASGEIYPSLLQDLTLAAQARGRSLIARSNAAAGEGWGLWGGATGRDGHVAGDGNAARSKFDGYGFDLGMDYRGADNAWAAGARVSWLNTNVQIDDRASSASGDGWALGGYARYGTGHAGFSASVAFDYAEGSMDTARSMAFGTLSRTTRAALDTNSIAASAELRYGLPTGGNWTVGPVASLDYGRGKIGGFSESGADALDLSSDGARSGATRYGGGAFASWQGEAGSFSLSAQYVTGKDRFADATLTLDGAPTTPFTIRSPLRQADGALLDLTAGFDLGRGWRLGADASALLASGNNDLRGRVSIGWQF